MRDALGSVQSVALFGGTSEIGLDIVRALREDRASTIVLAARDTGKAAEALPEATETVELDLARLDQHAAAAFAGSRAASTIVLARSSRRARTMSRPISEVPPNSATDWTEPSASFIRSPGRVAVPGPIA